MLQRLKYFLGHGIWQFRRSDLKGKRVFLFRPLRIFLLGLRGFSEDQCQLRASALTYYSLLSVVPVLALAFGVAKGFGLEARLQEIITAQMQGQQEVMNWLIAFSEKMLANAKGGLVGGVGVALLFWTVMKVLGNIEHSLNAIWGVQQSRTFGRRMSDYLSVMLIGPVVLIVSSGATVFVASQVTHFVDVWISYVPLRNLLLLSLNILPYVMIWALFSFLYLFLPNTRVSFGAGIFGGIVAGTLFQFVQWIYVFFQFGVSRYNAIYGSFAALPLFLVWLQLSWMVVLLGAELSFAVDNEETFEFEHDCRLVSRRFRDAVAVRLTQLVAERFARHEPPPKETEMAHQLRAPIRLVRDLLNELVEAGILARVGSQVTTSNMIETYQPGRDLHELSVHAILKALHARGCDNRAMVDEKQVAAVEAVLDKIDEASAKAAGELVVDTHTLAGKH